MKFEGLLVLTLRQNKEYKIYLIGDVVNIYPHLELEQINKKPVFVPA